MNGSGSTGANWQWKKRSQWQSSTGRPNPALKATAKSGLRLSIARTQLGSLLKQAAEKKARFVITKSGKPTAVLLSISDFDDIVEELDPEFQKSLRAAAKEIQAGKGITLKEYLKERLAGRRAG